ncbi:urease subunit alpha [Singulisphaera acidiphila]|uniref:Urease subunit alpha n=1 Tax=Singulisphaera acidiphila (strain ATCC BAA-1392 / DSM 18658 / VKM B-2454 / MOB10) TaxID=886293 RepID=L0D844_SINAD|nr:urease subunit alpha [Singulisphaera acidiphila]AGA25579.1 urease, alpha subunit [Singulisphaera acidiphila DSM 18658]
MSKLSRKQYVDLYGPTVGDKIRLGDTDLYIEIERDLRTFGDELQYGGGKTLRDGMGSDNQVTQASGCLDMVITNVTVLDPILGVVKADVGIRNGKIVGIGKAGNPSTMDNVTPGLTTGTATDAIAGEHLILTAAGMDGHIHYISPQQVWSALSNGITTFWGGGIGPSDGTNGVTTTNGPWNLEMMLRAVEGLPINFGFQGKGNSTGIGPLVEQLEGGAAGFKIHEDYGTTPANIRACLRVADNYDVSVSIHTDTLNEAGFVEDTIAAFDGRTIHTYHSEGAGGGHAPDLLKVVGQPNVLPSSTNPTLPCGVNSVSELFDMIMVCHNLSPKIPSDVAFAESRVRGETIVAESVLHDMGAISMITSDSQAMGRVGETWLRTMQTADIMKKTRGPLPEDASSGNDNNRVLRFVAKVTINPTLTVGISDVLGSIAPGKMADLVLWEPAFFGAKPKLVLKGGMIVWANMGDPNASLPTCQPMMFRPMFGAFGSALAKTCVTFVSRASYERGIAEKYGLQRIVRPVYGTRTLTKRHMIRNDFLPKIDVNPQTFAVTVDGVHATVTPPKTIALNQLHFFG